MDVTRRAWLSVPGAFFVNRLPLSAKEKAYFPPPDAQGGWRTLKDPQKIYKTTRIDVSKLDAAFEFCKGTSQHGGLLVARHPRCIYQD